MNEVQEWDSCTGGILSSGQPISYHLPQHDTHLDPMMHISAKEKKVKCFFSEILSLC